MLLNGVAYTMSFLPYLMTDDALCYISYPQVF